MTNNQKKGVYGEWRTVWYLRFRGYAVLERRYAVHNIGEIDIIATDGKTLAFVEVKTRESGVFVSPGEVIDAKKRHKICMTAQIYMKTHRELCRLSPRLDVSEVMLLGNNIFKRAEINYIEGAFSAENF